MGDSLYVDAPPENYKNQSLSATISHGGPNKLLKICRIGVQQLRTVLPRRRSVSFSNGMGLLNDVKSTWRCDDDDSFDVEAISFSM
jgi:hypothetical protein